MRLSVELRLKIAGIITVIIIFLIGSINLYFIFLINKKISEIKYQMLSFQSTYLSLEDDLKKLRNLLLEIVLSIKESSKEMDLAVFIKELKKFTQNYEKYLVTLNIEDKQDKSNFPIPAKLFSFESVLISSGTSIFSKNPQLIYEFQKNLEDIQSLLESNSKTQFDIISNSISTLNNIIRSSELKIGILTFLAIISSIILSIIFVHQIKAPVRRLCDLINTIRDGKYQIQIRSSSNDEFSKIFDALAHMVEHIAYRDKLKLDKISIEKNRFATLANSFSIPILLLNNNKQIAFANNTFLTLFQLSWDDIYEQEYDKTPLPIELKEKIDQAYKTHEWPQNEQLDVIGENYAFELKLTFVPINDNKGNFNSLLCFLGPLENK